MGNTDGAKNEIRKIAEGSPRYMDAKGILITTFRSTMIPAELKDYFKLNKRSFMVFDLNEDASGAFIDNEEYHDHLFRYMELGGEEKLNKMSRRLLRDIQETKSGVTTEVKTEKVAEVNTDDLSNKDIESMINTILDKGENMTDNDKKTLEELLNK